MTEKAPQNRVLFLVAHKPANSGRRVAYVVMIAECAFVSTNALFERPGGIVGRNHSLVMGAVLSFAGASLSP